VSQVFPTIEFNASVIRQQIHPGELSPLLTSTKSGVPEIFPVDSCLAASKRDRPRTRLSKKLRTRSGDRSGMKRSAGSAPG